MVGRTPFLLLTLAVEGGLGALAWLLGWLLDVPPLATLGVSGLTLLIATAATLPMAAMYLALMRGRWESLREIQQFLLDVIRPLFASFSLPELALVSLAAGCGEEMLFRGFLQAALAEQMGTIPGLLLASLIFGSLHLVTPAYGVIAALIGAYLGLLWLWTANLAAPILAHALYDFAALVHLTRFTSGGSAAASA